MRRVKGHARNITEGPGSLTPIGGAQRIAIVLDKPQITLFAQLRHHIQVERVAQRVRHHDRPRLRPDGLAKTIGHGVVRSQLDINHDWSQAVLHYRIDRRRKSHRDRQNLITPLQCLLPQLRACQGAQGDEVGARTAVDEYRTTSTHELRQLPLEVCGESTSRQPPVERCIHKVDEVLRAEHLSGYRHRGHSRLEGLRCQSHAGVGTHAFQNCRALVVQFLVARRAHAVSARLPTRQATR